MSEPTLHKHKKRKINETPEPQEQQEQIVIEQTVTIDIVEQWTTSAQYAIMDYLQVSPLKSVSEHIKPDHYKGFTPFLVDEIIRMATPYYGISLSAKTIIDSLDMVCKEACLLIGRQERFGEDYKKPRPITVYVEHLPMPSITLALEEEDPEQWIALPLGMRQILLYDKDRHWLAKYKEMGHESINVFSVRIGEATHLLSMLIPCVVLPYVCRLEKNDYLTSYELLLHEHQTNLFQLHSIQRISKNNAQLNAAVRLDELNQLKREVARLTQAGPSKEVLERQEEQKKVIENLLKQNAVLQMKLDSTAKAIVPVTATVPTNTMALTTTRKSSPLSLVSNTSSPSPPSSTELLNRIEQLEHINRKLKNTMLNHGMLKSKTARKPRRSKEKKCIEWVDIKQKKKNNNNKNSEPIFITNTVSNNEWHKFQQLFYPGCSTSSTLTL